MRADQQHTLPTECLAAIITALLTLVSSGPALASTVSVDDGNLEFVARRGERNRVTLRVEGTALVLRDRSLLTTGAGCVMVTAGVRCLVGPGELPLETDFSLGDGEDSFTMSGRRPVAVAGGPGDDRVRSGGDGDELEGGDGGDGMAGGMGADRLQGQAGADRLWGGAGDDQLEGGSGRDVLYGGPGRDLLFGDGGGGGTGGDDLIRSNGDGAPDVVDCEAGHDRVVADPLDYVTASCERIIGRRGAAASLLDASLTFVPGASTAMGPEVGCSVDAPRRCAGRLVSRVGAQVLGTARFSVSRAGRKDVILKLRAAVVRRLSLRVRHRCVTTLRTTGPSGEPVTRRLGGRCTKLLPEDLD